MVYKSHEVVLVLEMALHVSELDRCCACVALSVQPIAAAADASTVATSSASTEVAKNQEASTASLATDTTPTGVIATESAVTATTAAEASSISASIGAVSLLIVPCHRWTSVEKPTFEPTFFLRFIDDNCSSSTSSVSRTAYSTTDLAGALPISNDTFCWQTFGGE